jgi:uncharacterized OB-fold protein
MVTERPVRRMDPYAEQFWEFTKHREFRLQACDDCGKFRWPPAPVCDGCLSEQFTWTPIMGEGRLLSWVVFHRQYFPEYPPPHHVLMVELDAGPLFIAPPLELAADALHDGLRLQIAWSAAQDRYGDYNLPVFVPAGS